MKTSKVKYKDLAWDIVGIDGRYRIETFSTLFRARRLVEHYKEKGVNVALDTAKRAIRYIDNLMK